MNKDAIATMLIVVASVVIAGFYSVLFMHSGELRVGLNEESVKGFGLVPVNGTLGGNEGIVWFSEPGVFLHYAKAWHVGVVFLSERQQRAFFGCNGTLYGYEW